MRFFRFRHEKRRLGDHVSKTPLSFNGEMLLLIFFYVKRFFDTF